VCDSSGFTATTRRRGILHFLGLLIRSYQLTIPLVAAHGGTLIKNEADNLIAIRAAGAGGPLRRGDPSAPPLERDGR
jgi:hypothetical protein